MFFVSHNTAVTVHYSKYFVHLSPLALLFFFFALGGGDAVVYGTGGVAWLAGQTSTGQFRGTRAPYSGHYM
jgi:hypothetical protein